MLYRATISYVDSSGIDDCTNTFTRDTEFTEEELDTFKEDIEARINVKVSKYTISSEKTFIVADGAGDVNRKAIFACTTGTDGEFVKWQIPDPNGTINKPSGSMTSVLDHTTVGHILDALSTLIGKTLACTVVKVISRL